MAEEQANLVIAVVQPEDSSELLKALAAGGHGATYLTARGGFLDRHAVAVLILAAKSRRASIVQAIRSTCSKRTVLVTPVVEAELGYIPDPIEVEIGGAVMFALPVASAKAIGVAGLVPPTASAGAAGTSESGAEESTMVSSEPTTLLVAIVPDEAANRVVAALIERRYGATRIGSSGGFLRRGNTTILTGVPADQAPAAAELIETKVKEEQTGERTGGIVFALDVEWTMRV